MELDDRSLDGQILRPPRIAAVAMDGLVVATWACCPEASASTIHLSPQNAALTTRMPGPGSHRGLISINNQIEAVTWQGNPVILPARKSRQSQTCWEEGATYDPKSGG
jgi:hypothetical protein